MTAAASAAATVTPREQLLNRIQKDIPIVQRPYRVLAEEVGLTEAEALDILRAAKAEGVLRQVSAIFDTRTLGYQSSLVAAEYAEDRLDAGAEIVSGHPGVSHNYKRNHSFNLWYTIAVPPESDLEAHVMRLHELSGARVTRLMPTLHLFKIGVEFDMTGQEDWNAKARPQYTAEQRNIGYQVSDLDRAFVLEFQKDLPLTEEPYAAACAALGLTIDELAAHAERMKAAGALRRVSAVFRHQKAGFTFNAMGVWAVPQERVAEVGRRMAEFKAVSHCYLRPTYPEWPYTIFTMVHGRSKEEAFGKIAAIEQEVAQGIEHAILYSTKEYKKVRLEFYKPEFYQWARENLGTEA
ncbi:MULTISPECIES: Lrp/AsnC family transcriptional regulator [Deinococcus]|uniref:siroheme decarboxylase n=1 Tax=Deinococcus geothermalis (strain DSM 11300 / CIP 105573 / AG-3a) TaxID=319795 RepID=Q1IW03_DEIGD|nr:MULTISPECIES: Lrp/AsnC family transcriptional regulator [Deinococcus]ABF46581.1 putative transcriptional regulator, AsnC family [Deinococcus geothermalis DSM 11300]MBI0445100.1 Lrp/AsnC family transcriptional regulator [Deinococcus sp. DB0503]TDE86590.1 Lrp/AsnC family transcriptional regulator [Deinococcus sp. S9]